MIFYLCNNLTLVGTQAEAKALDKNFVQVDVPTDKAGLMTYINDIKAVNDLHISQNDLNSPDVSVLPDLDEIDNLRRQLKDAQSYTVRSGALQDEWDALPLAQQLTFACLALEEARNRIR